VKSKSTPIRRGGWWHPAALVLGVVGLAWAVMWFFYSIDTDLPGPETPSWIVDLGNWNWVIVGVLLVAGWWVASGTRPAPGPQEATGWRCAVHLMLGSAILGLVWIVTFYTLSNTDVDVPVISDLGNWNLAIGMGLIVAAFGFATKWE